MLDGSVAFADLALGLSAARDALLDGLNAGALTTTWIGHGAPDHWADEWILGSDDAPRLANTNQTTLLLIWACVSSDDRYFYGPSVSEALVLTPMAKRRFEGLTARPNRARDLYQRARRGFGDAGGGRGGQEPRIDARLLEELDRDVAGNQQAEDQQDDDSGGHAAHPMNIMARRLWKRSRVHPLGPLRSAAGMGRATYRLRDPSRTLSADSESRATVTPIVGGRFVRIDYSWSDKGEPQEGSLLAVPCLCKAVSSA